MNINSDVVSERFWSKVDVGMKIRCWLWRGAKDSHGYGQFRHNGKTVRAPRIAFWLRNGKWPLNACHKCDNPGCCNPDHIFDGSHSDNMRDMMDKDRHRSLPNRKDGRTVLNNKQVVSMRADYRTAKYNFQTLAQKYGCSFTTVQRIISGETWRHLL